MIVKGIDIDLIIIFTVYFRATRESNAGVFAFCQGFLLDALSGSVPGLFSFLYLMVYLTIRIVSHPIDLLSPGGRVAVVFIAAMAKDLIMVLLLSLFSFAFIFEGYSLLRYCLSAILTSIFAVFIFYFSNISEKMASSEEVEIL